MKSTISVFVAAAVLGLAAAKAASSVDWRIIPDDTNFPTSDAIVAGVVWGDTNVGQTVPKDPATQDCTTYVQAMIIWRSGQGGGTALIPAGYSGTLAVYYDSTNLPATASLNQNT
jgi:hypothetical protein